MSRPAQQLFCIIVHRHNGRYISFGAEEIMPYNAKSVTAYVERKIKDICTWKYQEPLYMNRMIDTKESPPKLHELRLEVYRIPASAPLYSTPTLITKINANEPVLIKEEEL